MANFAQSIQAEIGPLVGSKSAPILKDDAISGWESPQLTSLVGCGGPSHSRKGGDFYWAYCPHYLSGQDAWLQWSFQSAVEICQVWTKSYSVHHGVQAYRLRYSLDGSSWTDYATHIVYNTVEHTETLSMPLVAQRVQLLVVKWTGSPHLQVELFGRQYSVPCMEREQMQMRGAAVCVNDFRAVGMDDAVKALSQKCSDLEDEVDTEREAKEAAQEARAALEKQLAELQEELRISKETAGTRSGSGAGHEASHEQQHEESVEQLIQQRESLLRELDEARRQANVVKEELGKAEKTCIESEQVRLKLKYKGDTYCVCLESCVNHGDIEVATRTAMDQDLASLKATYVDEEGDTCVLNDGTFSDFLLTLQSKCALKTVVNLESISYKGVQVSDRHQNYEHCVGHLRCEAGARGNAAHDMDSDQDNDELSQQESNAEEGFEILEPSTHCFTKRALLRTPDGDYRTVSALQVGDMVLGSDGHSVEVAYKKEHPRQLRKFVTIRTAPAELMVTMDHRIVVQSSTREEKPASKLDLGDVVFCGSKPQKVTKIMKFEQRSDLVELRFKPDEAVETFMASPCGILTKGDREHLDFSLTSSNSTFVARNFGPLGPSSLEENVARIDRRRVRSCER